MRFRLSRLLLGLLLLAAPAAFAQTTTTAATTSTVTTTTAASTTTTTLAVTWQVVQSTDCTGNVAATGLTSAEVSCCTGAGAGPYCNELQNFGTYFEKFVQFASGSTVGYTSGGDLLTATQLAKLGLSRVSHAVCYNSTTGRIVRWRPTTASGQRAPKIQLFNSGGTEVSGATSVSNEAFSCLLFGYQ